MKQVIHTSERKDFKRCRQLWDFSSPNRLFLEPNREDRNLRFGSAIHRGLETYYDPATWQGDRAAVEALCLLAFTDAYPYDGAEGDVAQQDDWQADLTLGTGMLKGYFEWASKIDNFKPLAVEQKFEIELPYAFWGPTGWDPVYYAGKLDALVEDSHGDYWIIDHKTAGKFDPEDFLVMDEQVTSYCWAMQEVLQIPIAGFIYNELRKDVPHPPKVLKNGMLSKDKQQNTTYELYLDKIRELGHSPALYSDILEYLSNQGNKFFRRTYVRRSPRELELAGERILTEAKDMLDNPSIYPNPDRHCSWCSFRSPCLARMDGSDPQWILDGNFHKKEDMD